MRHKLSRSLGPITAALAVGLAGCGDDPVQPDALFEFVEAEAVVRSAAALPTLSEIVLDAPVTDPIQRATLDLAHQLWVAGSARAHIAGPAQRRSAVTQAGPLLAELVTDEEWAVLRVRTDEWTAIAEGMLRHLSIPAVEYRLASARRHLARSDDATSREDRVYHVLLAMSDLVETTPRFVARALVDRATRLVAAADGAAREDLDETASAALERARRLADWAARAMEDGDDVRAIQRAYYAIQLVEGVR